MDDRQLRCDVASLTNEWRDVAERVGDLAERTKRIEETLDCGHEALTQLVEDHVGFFELYGHVCTIWDAVDG